MLNYQNSNHQNIENILKIDQIFNENNNSNNDSKLKNIEKIHDIDQLNFFDEINFNNNDENYSKNTHSPKNDFNNSNNNVNELNKLNGKNDLYNQVIINEKNNCKENTNNNILLKVDIENKINNNENNILDPENSIFKEFNNNDIFENNVIIDPPKKDNIDLINIIEKQDKNTNVDNNNCQLHNMKINNQIFENSNNNFDIIKDENNFNDKIIKEDNNIVNNINNNENIDFNQINQNEDNEKSNETAPINVDLEDVNINFDNQKIYNNKIVEEFYSKDFNAEFENEGDKKYSNLEIKSIKPKMIYSYQNSNSDNQQNKQSEIIENKINENNNNMKKNISENKNDIINNSICDIDGIEIAHLNNVVKQNNNNLEMNNHINTKNINQNIQKELIIDKDYHITNIKIQNNAFNNHNEFKNNFKENTIYHLPEFESKIGKYPTYLKNNTLIKIKENEINDIIKDKNTEIYCIAENFQLMERFLKNSLKNCFYYKDLDYEALQAELIIHFEDAKNNYIHQFENHIINISSLDIINLINNNIIGPLKFIDQSIFDNKEKTIITNNELLKNNVIFDYYREIYSDGNSFYKSFIFKYFENCIITNNIRKLKILYFDLYNKLLKSQKNRLKTRIDNNKIKLGKIEIIIIFFYYLFEFMQQGNLPNTYEYFLKCFGKFSEIESYLSFYVRYVIAMFIKENNQILFSFEFEYFKRNEKINLINNSKNINLLPELYLSDSGYKFDEFIKDYIFVNHQEPYPFIIAISAFAFNIDVEILSYNNNQGYLTFYSCNRTENSISLEFPPITLLKNELYNINYKKLNLGNLGYNIAYEKGFSEAFKIKTPQYSLITFSSFNFDKNPNINNSFNEFNKINISNSKCSICNENNSLFAIRNIDYPNMICLKCIENVIIKTSRLRYEYFSNEKFFNMECKN